MKIRPEHLMNDMLDNACPNGGENKFYFESHCVRWCVEAVKVGGEWIIKSAEAEPW